MSILDENEKRLAETLPRGLFYIDGAKTGPRIGLISIAFTVVFLVIAGRLMALGLSPDLAREARTRSGPGVVALRPDIVDRNGQLLATSVSTASIFAEPRNIVDPDEASELLNGVFPDLNASDLRAKLASKKAFAWIARHVTPRQQAEVHRLGIPGVGFWPESKRVYPNGRLAAHVLGATNIDGTGIAGIEKYLDTHGLDDLSRAGLNIERGDLKPVTLSLDLRVQHALQEELEKGLRKYKAAAAAGVVYDVNSGEVLALSSLPDFDPFNPADALDPARINRINVGVFEMGSTLKALTTAMALDSGKVGINSTFDTSTGVLRWGKQTIHEYHGTGRSLTVPEVFVHSSNIGSAKMALMVGVQGHQEFLRKMGMLDRLRTELPESAAPIVPSRWGELNTMTIAFGHGLAVAPLQAVMAVGALVNGGKLIRPTFLKRSTPEASEQAQQVVKPETSEALRYVMRLNAVKGSASRAAVPGYFVGGKTGTAEKVINGRYAHDRLFTTFMAIVPADAPKYLFLTVMDEPQGIPETFGQAAAAWNSGAVTGHVIERVAPMLLAPRFNPPMAPFPTMERLHAWGTQG
ncbi:penicillin-binding protein 2 [uncultured Alsobacter sp.]|uniref:peptidoglycan D,D-transpeptidase FtsI family protein n=1 Tax=uncultured Alsobacter sp. TaxID=1748258 RepID=UPI0025D216F2|nr:penicillin-binding protein 2 [uncultured Alsobacter sp.]